MRDGLRMQVDTASWIEWNVFFWGAYDARLRDFLSGSLDPSGTAIDVGANVGAHALAMARATPRGRVLACEPNPTVAGRLRANVALNGLSNVSVHEVAVGEVEGSASLTVPGAQESNQGTARLSTGTAVPGSIEVPVVTLDVLAEAAGLDRLDLIKIDVEGLDMAVLRGAERALRRWRPLLVFEYDRSSWEAAGYDLAMALGWLEDHGYRHFGALGPRGLAELVSEAPEAKNIVALAEPIAWHRAATMQAPPPRSPSLR